MAYKTHFLNLLDHLTNLNHRNTGQTDKYFIHHHLNHHIIYIFMRCHNRNSFYCSSLYLSIIISNSCDIIIPCFIFLKSSYNFFSKHFTCEHQHLGIAIALSVVVQHKFFKYHVSCKSNNSICDCEYRKDQT